MVGEGTGEIGRWTGSSREGDGLNSSREVGLGVAAFVGKGEEDDRNWENQEGSWRGCAAELLGEEKLRMMRDSGAGFVGDGLGKIVHRAEGKIDLEEEDGGDGGGTD